jgi:hypothetical protein
MSDTQLVVRLSGWIDGNVDSWMYVKRLVRKNGFPGVRKSRSMSEWKVETDYAIDLGKGLRNGSRNSVKSPTVNTSEPWNMVSVIQSIRLFNLSLFVIPFLHVFCCLLLNATNLRYFLKRANYLLYAVPRLIRNFTLLPCFFSLIPTWQRHRM